MQPVSASELRPAFSYSEGFLQKTSGTLKKFFSFKFPIAALVIASFALTSCGPALTKKKDESAIHYRMGIVHFNDRNYTDALQELLVAIDLYPDDPTYHKDLGLTYFAKGMNNEAIKELQKAISLDPKYADARVSLSAVYLVERRYDEAIAECREALKNIFYRTPEFAYFNMGMAHLRKSDYKNSIESFRKAVDLSPNYAMAYYNMGSAFEKIKNTKDAVDSYEKAVKSFPGYLDAQYSLGAACLKVKDKACAMKAFEKVIELAPESDKAISAKDYINLIK